MKNIFKSFYQPADIELEELWDKAIFVFDTNVLTNLYRYQSSTRESLLKVMEQLNDRVWIPHHVALEYQRNRLTVVGEQHKKFNDTKKIVESAVSDLQKKLENLQLKKRHSHINPDSLINGINELSQQFFKELDDLEADSIKVGTTDLLRDRLDNLFAEKVGEAPSQECILSIEKEGKERFNKQIPPGYQDSNKAKNGNDSYIFSGVEYHRQYGDLIVWKQILEYVKLIDIKHLIFITDDNKEDWWQKNQGKTISLRTELIDEIFRETNLKSFYAYKSESFLTNANKYLDENVSEEVIKEVKLTSDIQKDLDGSKTVDPMLEAEYLENDLNIQSKWKNALERITKQANLASLWQNDLERITKQTDMASLWQNDLERITKQTDMASLWQNDLERITKQTDMASLWQNDLERITKQTDMASLWQNDLERITKQHDALKGQEQLAKKLSKFDNTAESSFIPDELDKNDEQ
ncbi:putative uncharacterized phage protein [Aliivibrio wodanis]|uniref:Uncharacterized phage protein n=1 Tax=Aliivibrio wodanis TaxID=80852 RepID=A0A090IT40_9GAMM|nr:putative uncharacterized phage protein [Aliivibrio wodanis]